MIKITIEYNQEENKAIIYTNDREYLIEYDKIYGRRDLTEILDEYIKYDM